MSRIISQNGNRVVIEDTRRRVNVAGGRSDKFGKVYLADKDGQILDPGDLGRAYLLQRGDELRWVDSNGDESVVTPVSAAAGAALTTGGDTDLHYHDSDRQRANHTGTQPVATITGLGTAATTDSTEYATAAQGSLADSALQSESDPVFTGSQAANITAQNIADLGNLSGTNTGDQDLSGYSLTSHNHSGTYEPADATILKDADIGVNVQAYSAALGNVSGTNTGDQDLSGYSPTSHNHSGTYEPADATILKDADIGVNVQAYSAALGNVSGTNTGDQDLSGYAPLSSPALTNIPTAPTAAAGTDTTQIATTAFVQAESVSLSGDTMTGGLTAPGLTLPALSSSPFLGVGAVVDSKVYDTSQDPDGGQWRNSCQNKSWYAEAEPGFELGEYRGPRTTAERDLLSPSEGDLIYNTTTAQWEKYIADNTLYIGEHYGDTDATWNATTRGVRAEFPAVAAVIAEATKVWIFDVTGSEPVLWMRFDQGGSYPLNSMVGQTSAAIGTISVSSAIITIGYGTDAVRIIKLCIDACEHLYPGTPRQYKDTIVMRNNQSGWVSITKQTVLDQQVNDIAITQLPNAAINPDTGLPYNTIAVATDGNGTYSVSIIDEEAGAVYDVASDSTGTATSVAISSDYELIVTRSDGTVYVWDNIGAINADGVAPDTTITAAIGTTTLVEAA